MFIPSARTAGQFAAVLFCTFAFVAAGQDKKTSEQPAQKPVLSPNETAAVTAVETPSSLLGSDLDQVASGFAGSTGKMAVIKRLEALFKGPRSRLSRQSRLTRLRPILQCMRFLRRMN